MDSVTLAFFLAAAFFGGLTSGLSGFAMGLVVTGGGVGLHQVVAQPHVERQVAARPPLVLHEERILVDVRVRFRPGRAGALEVLLVELVGAVRPAAGKRRERAERVRPAEEAGEVVQDVVELKIEPALEFVLRRAATSRYRRPASA